MCMCVIDIVMSDSVNRESYIWENFLQISEFSSHNCETFMPTLGTRWQIGSACVVESVKFFPQYRSGVKLSHV